MKSLLLLAGIVTLGMLQPCTAGTVIKCPPTVRMESGQIAAADVPPNFRTSISKRSFSVEGGNFFSGPPEQEAVLMPDNANDPGPVSRKRFYPEDKSEKWVSCDYGGDMIRLVTRLDDATKQCRSIYKSAGKGRPDSMEYHCE